MYNHLTDTENVFLDTLFTEAVTSGRDPDIIRTQLDVIADRLSISDGAFINRKKDIIETNKGTFVNDPILIKRILKANDQEVEDFELPKLLDVNMFTSIDINYQHSK